MVNNMSGKLVLVTGGNRGIGLEVCREFLRAGASVLLGCRSLKDGQAVAQQLEQELDGASGRVTPLELDVSQEESVKKAVALVQAQYPQKVNVLVNNAGVLQPGWDRDIFDRTLNTNLRGAINLTEGLLPYLAPGASIVNVSSGLGELSGLRGAYAETVPAAVDLDSLLKAAEYDPESEQGKLPTFPHAGAYNLSKALLNRYTQILSKDARVTSKDITVNSVCPGWCRTDMGTANANRSAEQGGKSVYLAAVTADTGKFWRDGVQLVW